MNNRSLDKYLNIVNEEKIKRGLNNYVPLYPMIRIEENKMYIGVLLTKMEDKVWDIDGNVKPSYWILIDIDKETITEFNETEKKDFVIGKIINKNNNYKQKEISKYTIKKTLQYENYIMEDIKKERLPIQEKLNSLQKNSLEIDGEKVNINEYLLSTIEEELKTKIKEIINILVRSKYSIITFYYDNLFNEILNIYKIEKRIDKEKLKLIIEIMNNYYDGVLYINNFFNFQN